MKAASLNHVFRVVWSHIQNAWTVVSETASSSGKKSSVIKDALATAPASAMTLKLTSRSKIKLGLAVAMSGIAMSNPAFALPTGADNVYGSFDAVTNGSTMTIHQHTDKSIVNWQTFSIASGEAVNLLQPAGGVALYRVVGNNTSEIYGQLTASGQLFLINPNGIIFGASAQVSVGSIVASTLDIKNDDFLNGRYHFSAADNFGSVINKGTIKANKDEGYIVLLGKTVENEGTLVANNGSVVLGAAKEAVLDFYGNGLVKARLTGEAVDALVKNSGLIQANGGFVQLATNARSAAINVSGIIEANQLVERDGVIRLEGGDNAKVQVSGQLIAKGEGTTGGNIQVTGEQVALMKGALLDASGDTGGGTVLVGGDYQGKNGDVYNARTTYVAEGATIKADALKEGNGGKVVVWADDLTRFYGQISALGGSISGNGGFVEVSGKQDLTFMGGVNLTAINGVGGKLLLDPENINLVSSSQVAPSNNANGTPDVAFADNAGSDTFIEVSDVVGFSELFLQANNNININAPVTMAFNSNIRFEANNDINVNAALTTRGFGKINLKADADGVGGGNIAIGANITGQGGVVLSAATISHTAGDISSSGNLLLGIAGGVTINTTGAANLGSANINATGINTAGNAPGNGGDVHITANSLTMTGNIDTSGASSTVTTERGGQGGAVTIQTANNASVGNIVTSGGNAGATSTQSSLSGGVQVTSTSGNVITGNINSNGGSNGLGASVALSAAGSVTAGTINASAGAANPSNDGKSAGNVTVNAGTGITVGDITASGANGNGTNKSGGVAGAVNLTTTAGDINMAAITNKAGTATGTGVAGSTAKVFAQAGQDVIMNGDIQTDSKAADAVQLVAGRNFINNTDKNITTGTGGRWTIYSADPTNDVKGAQLLAAYNYKQYGTKFGGALLGTGNGFVHAVSPTVTATLTGTSTKVVDGTNIVTDLSGLSVTTTGVLDGDKVTINPTPITSATFDNAAVGAAKPINSTFNVVSITTNEGKQIFNPTAGTLDGYTVVNGPSAATGSITALPVTTTTLAISFPRDSAGLGGLIGNNPVLNSMTIVSLNPAAGDEEDLDAVACPTNEDKLGSTPILNSGVKLPNGVSANCI